MSARVVLATLSLGVCTAASAEDRGRREIEVDEEEVNTRSVSVLIGSDTALNDRPATLRLGVQGEGRVLGGQVASLSAVLPVTYMTSGTDAFGVSTRQSVLEIPPSLRLRVFSLLPVRPYADLGVGLAFATRSEENWLLEDHDGVAGWMTRSALGLEIGETDGLMIVLEPSIQTYRLGETYARVAGMIGVGGRF